MKQSLTKDGKNRPVPHGKRAVHRGGPAYPLEGRCDDCLDGRSGKAGGAGLLVRCFRNVHDRDTEI